ncbi:MAG: NifU family protein [Elusimicrobia bacterium]|nr:NifU family protein [Elusimicrobiota bacterium]
MRDLVLKAIDHIRPFIQGDGGDIELVDITPDRIVRVRLTGACEGCPFSAMTLRGAVEEEIKRLVPDIKSVESVE